MRCALSYSSKAAVAAIVWCSATAITAFAVDPKLSFDHYTGTRFTAVDGLPAGVVDHIQQTPDGFLWLIANSGELTRFDGRHFHGFRGIRAHTIAVAPDGDLWVGSREGLWRIPFKVLSHGDLSEAICYRPGQGPASNILSLCFGRNDVLWVGTKQGLFRFDSGQFSPVGPREEIQQIEQAANGDMFLGTAAGFMKLDDSLVVHPTAWAVQLGMKPEDMFHVMEDSHGQLWCCNSKGVAQWTGSQWVKLPPYGAKGHGAFFAYEDGQDNIWVAGTEGLYRAAASGLELSVPGMQVRSVYSDRDGALWLGTNGDGLHRFKDPSIKMYTTADGLPNDVVMTVLAAHDGTIWIGANCGGLTHFDGMNFRTYNERDGLLNSCVWALAEDANHDLWIGTWGGGAFQFHAGRFTQILAGEIVISIAATRDSSVWFTTRGGPTRLKDGRLRTYTTADGLSSNATFKIFEDRSGRVLAGTRVGVDLLVGERFETFVPGLKAIARPIGEDRSGGLFIELDGETFALRVEAGRVDSLPELRQILGLVEADSGELWFGGLGIHRVSAGSLSQPRRRDEPLDDEVFGTPDGLPTTDISSGNPNIALANDGTIWIATLSGLATIDPRRLPRGTDPPLIYVSEVTVGRDTRSAPRELLLPAGTSHIEVKFAAVEIASPEKIRMQYRLDGVDEEWLDAGTNPRAVYSSLAPGAYALHLRASNRSGMWDRKGIVYPIYQEPHYYQTGWFLGLVVLMGLLLIGGVHHLRVNQLSRLLSARFEERLAERTRIAGELHDTILQGVLSASMQLHVATNKLPAESPVRNRVEQVHRLLTRLTEDARRSVQGLRSARTELTDDLRHAFSLIPEELGEANGASFKIIVNGQPLPLRPMVSERVYRIGRESILNAFRHSGANSIEVKISYLDGELRVAVQDDGRGIDSRTLRSGREGHWGLAGMRELAESLGARLTVRGVIGEGTKVELIVPGRVAFQGKSMVGLVRGFFRRILPGRLNQPDNLEV